MDDKKLVKSNSNRVVCGVCGGVGEYFNIDPTFVRLGFVLFTMAGGSGLLLYLIMAIIMPEG
ncbi:MAG: PspC domain-containing protein [Clostridia bacterium]|nr:PspC domain-containing protein [Clostridia bacterium]